MSQVEISSWKLTGADGENSTVAQAGNFERKTFKGSQAIGITANFHNLNSQLESSIQEFGLLSIYNQQFFGGLKSDHDIDLENLVEILIVVIIIIFIIV